MEFLPATAVPPLKIAECLSEIGRHDPLIVPPRSGSMVGHFRAAVLDGVVAGVGWLYRQGARAEIDVRVIPRYRKQGVGTGLFEALTRNYEGSVHAGCDAGQTNARKFLEGRNFEMIEMLFAKRWDGDESDVPSAFASVELTLEGHAADAIEVLNIAYGTAWNAPAFNSADLQRADVDAWFAQRDGEVVGTLVSRQSGDSWWVGGLGTLPTCRRQGVARALLCNTMKRAARQGKGVVLLVPAVDESLLRWTAGLGFWTYRSWAHYYRAATSAATS